jgi:hypothetical protein
MDVKRGGSSDRPLLEQEKRATPPCYQVFRYRSSPADTDEFTDSITWQGP